MNNIDRLTPTARNQAEQSRRGAFMVVAAISLATAIGFVALSVDLGMIALTKTNLQKAADMAALAAAQEIIASIDNAGQEADSVGGGSSAAAINSISISAAKAMAEKVADLNGVYIDPDKDVSFGRRVFNENTEEFDVEWGEAPYSGSETYNVVGVTCRRDNPDVTQPDGMLQLFFAPLGGTETASVKASAVAFVEARDIVTILDYSRSMNYDSQLRSINTFGRTALEANIEAIFNALQPLDVGDMVFEPAWLVVEGPDPVAEGDPKVFVTFKDTEVEVLSDKEISEVRLIFEDDGEQTFDDLSSLTGTFAGTGNNDDEPIYAVWVTAGEAQVTVTGQPSQHPSQPYIEVTFEEDSIYVESTKDLSNVVLEFSDGVHQKVEGLSGKTGTFSGTGSNSGKTIVNAWIKSGNNASGDGPGYGESFGSPGVAAVSLYFADTNDNVKICFDLDNTSYPYQSGNWDSYINYVRSSSTVKRAGYRKMYGGITFVDYLLHIKTRNHQTSDLWKTPHYPFHALKNGMSLFLDFLDDLEFGDHVGIVTYDSVARTEEQLFDENGVSLVDLNGELITDDYAGLDTIQRRKQAGHYDIYTGLGYGIEEAVETLDEHKRTGSRPTLLVMTDGQANRSPNGWSLPGDWDWDELTDYNGDGSADYTTGNRHKQYAFYEAKVAIDHGYTVHTLSMGAGADRDLMRAIAFAGSGEWINVPGGATIAEIEEQMLDAFARIAANVPPAKLLRADE